jgi:hypothetical protein
MTEVRRRKAEVLEGGRELEVLEETPAGQDMEATDLGLLHYIIYICIYIYNTL